MSDLNPYEEGLANDLAKAEARIEELEAKLKWADEISNIQADRIEELEAKLDEALDWLSKVRQYAISWDDRYLVERSDDILAKLKARRKGGSGMSDDLVKRADAFRLGSRPTDQQVDQANLLIDRMSSRIEELEAKLAALTSAAIKVHDSYWNSTDGVITGMYDLEWALRLAELKGEDRG